MAQLLDAVLTVAGTSGDLSEIDREQFVETGAAAFTAGKTLSGLIESYLGGAGEVWEHVFANAELERTVDLGRSLRRVSEQAVSSLAVGYEAAQRLSIRAEESLRRTFIDDVLDTAADPQRLAELADQLGFPPVDRVAVAVAGGGRDVADGGAIQRRVRVDLESRAPERPFVVTAKDGRLVVLAMNTSPTVLGELLVAAAGTLPDVDLSIGLGGEATALEAIGASYHEALAALSIGRVFGLRSPIEFGRILPQRILSAAPDVAGALVEAVLDPLTEKPKSELVETLASFIEHGGNMAEVARDLSVGARTVAYRLDRIAALTGYSVRRADDRFVLELAYRALPLTKTKRGRR